MSGTPVEPYSNSPSDLSAANAGIGPGGTLPTTSSQSAAEAETGASQNTLVYEFGATGLKRSGGIVTEEYLTQLSGPQGRKVFIEMATDPLISGVLLALNEVIGRLNWEIAAPENPSPEESAQAQFVQECLDDMSSSWDVILTEILSMNTFGWSFLESVYKIRSGPQNSDPSYRSRFNDGKIGWRKFSIRAQETLANWIFDANGGLRGMRQYNLYTAPTAGAPAAPMSAGSAQAKRGMLTIPIQRGLLFRTEEHKDNPEGRSLLRGAYTSWYYKKRIQEIEAIGIERDFAGMPVVYAPEEWFEDPNNKNITMIKDTIKKAKRNELDGVLMPMVRDDNGNQMLTFTLMSSGGARQFDTNAVIARYNNAIATSMLMDFLTLGHEGVGSWSLGTAKISMWQLVVESLAKGIASVVNQHAIPRLMVLNGWMPDRMPELVFGDVAQADLAVLGTFLAQMITGGVIVPDETLESYVRELLNLPPSSPIVLGGPDVGLGDPAAAPIPQDLNAPTGTPATPASTAGQPAPVAPQTAPAPAPAPAAPAPAPARPGNAPPAQ